MRVALLLTLLSGCTSRLCWFGRCEGDGAPTPVDSGVGPADSATVDSDCPPGSPVTWENTAEPLLDTWCVPCHSSHLEGEWRLGAPEGINFDTYELVVPWVPAILAASTGPAPTMPPSGGVPPGDLEHLAEWVACGAVGPAPEVGPCDEDRPVGGDLTLSNATEVADFCLAGNRVEGTLTLSGTDLQVDCLCQVTGDLLVRDAAGRLELPRLHQVGGTLEVRGNPDLTGLQLPDLLQSGPVLFQDNPLLDTPDLRRLEAVTGSLQLHADGATGEWLLPNLLSVSGALEVEDAPGLTAVQLTRLRSVGRDLAFRRLAGLETLAHFNAVETVGGSLLIEENPRLAGTFGMRNLEALGGGLLLLDNDQLQMIDGFNELLAVPGPVHINGNERLERVLSFHKVATVGEDLTIVDNPNMVNLDAFNLATNIGGSLRIEGNGLGQVAGFLLLDEVEVDLTLLSNPQLLQITGLPVLRRVGGRVEVRANDRLENLDLPVQEVGGSLQVFGNTNLVALRSFPSLTQVGGLEIGSNPRLVSLRGLATLTEVAGSLRVTDQGQLSNLAGLSYLARVESDLEVARNSALSDVSALGSLTWIGGDLLLVDNPSLASEAAWALADTLAPYLQGEAIVRDNGS